MNHEWLSLEGGSAVFDPSRIPREHEESSADTDAIDASSKFNLLQNRTVCPPLTVFLSLRYLYLLNLVALAGCADPVELVSIQVGETSALVEVAETRDQRKIGLMNRHALEPNEGMLFIFQEEQIVSFWMKNTPLALDIGFFDRDGVLLSYGEMKPLDDKTIHRSPKPALYALEMPQGWFKANKILIGAQLRMRKMLHAN